MTKLDLVIERIRQLPEDRQEAVALQIDFLLDDEEGGSLLTDEQWAEVAKALDDDEEEIPHEQIVAEFRAKFPE